MMSITEPVYPIGTVVKNSQSGDYIVVVDIDVKDNEYPIKGKSLTTLNAANFSADIATLSPSLQVVESEDELKSVIKVKREELRKQREKLEADLQLVNEQMHEYLMLERKASVRFHENRTGHSVKRTS